MTESGYAPINTSEWIHTLHPQFILMDVAAGDEDGFLHKELLETIKDYTLLRTDENGWIKLTPDGEEMWIEVKRR